MSTKKSIVIADRRLALRLSLDELGRRCGIERSKLSRGERGYVAFTERELLSIANELEVAPEQLHVRNADGKAVPARSLKNAQPGGATA